MTKVVQLVGQSNKLLPILVISTNSTLDMPLVLSHIRKDSSVTNRLNLSLGNNPHLGFLHSLGCNDWQCGVSIVAAIVGH